MMKFILILSLTLFSFNLYSQVTQEWVKSYTGPNGNGAQGVKVLADQQNNIYVLGIDFPCIDIQCRDYSLIKYNQSGVEQWIARYNGPENWRDIPTDLAVDELGNIIVTGYASTTGETYYTTIKYNSAGQQQWISTYHSPSTNLYNNPTAIVLDDSGNVYVTGYSSIGKSSSDYLTIKYTPNGVEQWVARFDYGGDFAHDLKVDNSGNVYVTGYSTADTSFYSIVTVKYNSMGQQQWVNTRASHIFMPRDYSCKLEIDNSGNIYVAGTANDFTAARDYILLKYDTNGNLLWEEVYGSIYNDTFYDLTLDQDDNVYVTGYYSQIGLNGSICKTIKYSPSGSLLQELTYDGPGLGDYPSDIKTDVYGNVYISGATRSPGSNIFFDFFTVKFNPLGTLVWDVIYDENKNNNYSNSLILDKDNNVYIIGTVEDSIYNMTIIKYSQTTGIPTLSNELPQKFSLGQNYPNPFNPFTNINFEIANTSHVKLVIYDALGREVSILADESMQPGSYNANFSADGLNSGIYFYSLITESYKDTKKMILLK